MMPGNCSPILTFPHQGGAYKGRFFSVTTLTLALFSLCQRERGQKTYLKKLVPRL
jgi:hypothetical protein